ncbi:MAG: cbb3-type cytochrome oxidase assembly protein CcoS [Bacteroidota bacterium]
MGIIVLLISISLIIAVGFLISFLWNLKNGQYDDTYSPSVRMLFEDGMKITLKRRHQDAKTSKPGKPSKKI